MTVFNLGFRCFFLAAIVFSVLAMVLWTFSYGERPAFLSFPENPVQWHAHEMLFGYAFAVIAGFLLTAVKNWTGRQTLNGLPLAGLLLCWLIARLLFLAGGKHIAGAAVFDLLFGIALMVAVAQPIVAVRQWRQLAILGKVLILILLNVLFYAGVLTNNPALSNTGTTGALYLIIGLILTIARRVAPMFIQNGVGYPVVLRNHRWIDIASLVVFLLFFLVETLTGQTALGRALAGTLFVIHCIRLIGWHTPGIWKKPLLFSLYLPLWLICFGFLLHAIAGNWPMAGVVSLHAFAVGGVGLMTASMMSRVSTGHTGRRIDQPPAGLTIVFIALILAFAARVIGPLLVPANYPQWVLLAQLFWISGFLILAVIMTPVLTRPRVDGKPG